MRVAFNGTDQSTGVGLSSTVSQMNDKIVNGTGGFINLQPNQLNFNFIESSGVNIPGTELRVSVNVPLTVSIRTNPLTMAAVGIAAEVPILVGSWQAGVSIFGGSGLVFAAQQ